MRTPTSWAVGCVLAIAARAIAEAPAAPAPAATTAPSSTVGRPDAARYGGIEEIVVTGHGREELAQDYGGSISAFSAEMLESQNIQDIHDLGFRIPSFVATNGFAQVTVRGLGRDIVAPSSDSGFGVHVDGVPMVAESGQLDYFDVERVEVLRGPRARRVDVTRPEAASTSGPIDPPRSGRSPATGSSRAMGSSVRAPS